MKIPTPTLIQELRHPIPRTWWDGKVQGSDASEVEILMREAAAQLEWFLKRVTELEKEKREVI